MEVVSRREGRPAVDLGPNPYRPSDRACRAAQPAHCPGNDSTIPHSERGQTEGTGTAQQKSRLQTETAFSRHVPKTGLEPAWGCPRQHLKLVRLPIPPPGHAATTEQILANQAARCGFETITQTLAVAKRFTKNPRAAPPPGPGRPIDQRLPFRSTCPDARNSISPPIVQWCSRGCRRRFSDCRV